MRGTPKQSALIMTFYVYILTNAGDNVFYTGVTNDLARRVSEHQSGKIEGFTKRYKAHKLVYYETTDNPESAIVREKQLKGGSRQKKIDLIKSFNPEWQDLAEDM